MELRFLPTSGVGGGAGTGVGVGAGLLTGLSGSTDLRGGYNNSGPTHPHHLPQFHQHHHHQSHSPSPGGGSLVLQTNNNCPTPDSHRRTLERSLRSIQHADGDLGISRNPPLPGSRRVRRSSGSGPGNSPRIIRGISSEYLQHNRSPMPVRSAIAMGGGSISGKRGNRLGNRTDNLSSGSLNSIEV